MDAANRRSRRVSRAVLGARRDASSRRAADDAGRRCVAARWDSAASNASTHRRQAVRAIGRSPFAPHIALGDPGVLPGALASCVGRQAFRRTPRRFVGRPGAGFSAPLGSADRAGVDPALHAARATGGRARSQPGMPAPPLRHRGVGASCRPCRTRRGGLGRLSSEAIRGAESANLFCGSCVPTGRFAAPRGRGGACSSFSEFSPKGGRRCSQWCRCNRHRGCQCG